MRRSSSSFVRLVERPDADVALSPCSYSTAKSAIIGLTRTLAIEGKKYGIQANVLVPNAGTSMTATIWPEEMVKAFAPDFVAPVVCYLGSEACETTMGLYEVSGGWCASLRWQRSYGYAFPVNKKVQVEDVAAKWDTITRFDDKATNPNSTAESLEAIVSNFANEADGSDESDGGADYTDSEDSELVADAKKSAHSSGSYDYTERDIALYNLGIGATEKDLDLVFEGDDGFKPVPTFGVIPQVRPHVLSACLEARSREHDADAVPPLPARAVRRLVGPLSCVHLFFFFLVLVVGLPAPRR